MLVSLGLATVVEGEKRAPQPYFNFPGDGDFLILCRLMDVAIWPVQIVRNSFMKRIICYGFYSVLIHSWLVPSLQCDIQQW